MDCFIRSGLEDSVPLFSLLYGWMTNAISAFALERKIDFPLLRCTTVKNTNESEKPNEETIMFGQCELSPFAESVFVSSQKRSFWKAWIFLAAIFAPFHRPSGIDYGHGTSRGSYKWRPYPVHCSHTPHGVFFLFKSLEYVSTYLGAEQLWILLPAPPKSLRLVWHHFSCCFSPYPLTPTHNI